jgi:oxygen-dependent protoporphyrinogen oxidase
MIGGAHDPAAVGLDDEQLVAVAREGLRLAMGIEAAPRFTHVQRWSRGIAQYVVGHAERAALIEERGRVVGLFATGQALRGVGVNDVIREAARVAEKLT